MASLSFISAAKLADLLASASKREKAYVRVLTSTKLALGVDPLQPTSVIDLAKEEVIPYKPEAALAAASAGVVEERAPYARRKAARRSGLYWYELKGQRRECSSLRELLSGGLKAIEQNSPGALEKLSHIKPRSKRIVARHPGALFDDPNLIGKYSDRLLNGWWYGTNNSAQETRAWLQRACSCADLTWGADFNTSI